MNYTEHHNLPQWEKDDRIMMEDFNAAMAALDTLPKVVTGYYIGDGSDSRTIELPFTPKAILVINQTGAMAALQNIWQLFGGLAVTNSSTPALSVAENGFTVRYYINNGQSQYYYTNQSGMRYNYIAIG